MITMADNASTTGWKSAPQRRFRDVASPSPSRDADRLRAVFLEIGLKALSTDEEERLIVPPLRSNMPKRLSGQKDLHRNRFLEVGIVTRGEMTLWWEGTLVRCPAGSVFVIPPGMRYMPHATAPGTTPVSHSVVWLALHRGCAVVHMCSIEGSAHHLGEYYQFTETQVTGLARSIGQELSERAAHYNTALRGSLLCLLTWMLRAPVYRISRFSSVERETKPFSEEAFNDRVEAYLLTHYHRPLSLGQIAVSVGCSPAYLCRRFRELTGQTPFQYLRDIRIEAAKRLLHSEVPIARVAEMVGFDDPLYFSKVFSGQVGASPQAFRKQQSTNVTDSK